ncbi:aromatic amino acid ammonia-lyase [bacterium]|nr:aromatic amino acid ammonia-lyase [bacterium]
MHINTKKTETKTMTITLQHDKDLNLDQIDKVGNSGENVNLSKTTRLMLQKKRDQLSEYISQRKYPAYGFNRGFGHNVDLQVEPELLSKLQENLIISHAVGMGEPLDDSLVRYIMLFRAQSLCRGYSGIRPEVVEQLLAMLNHNIIPLVPELGSVGASGDLAPLSHVALALIGKGNVRFQGKVISAALALKKAGLSPLKLEMKEGLALNNGIQFMTAIGVYCCQRMQVFLKTACIQTAMTAQVMLATETPFREDLHRLRPHPGSLKTARWIYDLMKNSPLREAHREYLIDGEIQDPYNLRCAAQILGPCAELIDECEAALLLEINSVTDNPIILPADKKNGWKKSDPYYGQSVDIVSAGHFHGMPIAVRIYNLLQAMGIMAGLINQRCARFVDGNRNKGLGRDLKWPDLPDKIKAISSIMMMPEYSSAALANAIWGEAMPSHLFNISTNSGQEDHVSMGSGLAVRVMKALPKLGYLLAIEMAYIIQAAAIRKQLSYIPSRVPLSAEIKEKLDVVKSELQETDKLFSISLQVQEQYSVKPGSRKLNPVGELILKELSSVFPPVEKDTFLSERLQALAETITAGKTVDLAESMIVLK